MEADVWVLEADAGGLAASRPAEVVVESVPHAGYRYSGPTAAVAYKQVAGREIRTVIVMAPSHYADFQGAFVSEAEAYETPMGRVALAPMARELVAHQPFVARPGARVQRPSWADESPRQPPHEQAPNRAQTSRAMPPAQLLVIWSITSLPNWGLRRDGKIGNAQQSAQGYLSSTQ